MIRELLAKYGENSRRIWDYDRKSWVGSSEVGKCLRQVAFGKLEAYEPDPEFIEGWGYQIRGNFIEDFAVRAIRAVLPEGATLKYAGEEQETLVDEWLSATTDGVFVGMPRDWLADKGVPDTGHGGVVWDCKSLDPRYSSRLPKPEHTAQVQAAMGIIRKSYYPECPEYAVLSYIDASDWSRCQEFVVKFDPKQYQAALDRARAIKFADDPVELPPEGKIIGGGECRWCPYQRQCGDGQVASLPEDRGVRLPADAVAELKSMRDIWVKMAGAIADNTYSKALAEEAIKALLRTHGARAHKETDGSWSVVWSTVKGSNRIDTKALLAAGIDLDPFRKEGTASERLTVK
jgi:hypothetical protein